MNNFNLDNLTLDELTALEAKLRIKIREVQYQKTREAAQKIKSLMDEINELSDEYGLDVLLDVNDYVDTAFYECF